MGEQWKAIAGYGDDYEVSDLGRIKSLKRGKLRMLKQNANSAGYLVVRLCSKNKCPSYYVHLLVAKAFLGSRPKGHEANHKDGIKRHNNATNLEWVTPAENSAHAARMGLVARGERNHLSKLTVAQVIEMRRLHALGKTHRELGRIFETSRSNVSFIVRRETWKHVATPQKGRVT